MMNAPVAIFKLDELVSRYVPLSKGEESATHATAGELLKAMPKNVGGNPQLTGSKKEPLVKAKHGPLR
jgi:hypothetical protein